MKDISSGLERIYPIIGFLTMLRYCIEIGSAMPPGIGWRHPFSPEMLDGRLSGVGNVAKIAGKGLRHPQRSKEYKAYHWCVAVHCWSNKSSYLLASAILRAKNGRTDADGFFDC